MRFRTPAYYKDFTCIADRCTDNCCIGWEIDIDNETAAKYAQVPGTFGDRLRLQIQFGEPSYFILDKDERCPFLNSRNLCDIFTNLGESALCQICSDHPRYYEWFGDSKEGGIGLCCEEAARIILTQTEPFSIVETEIPDEECELYDDAMFACLQDARQRIFTILQDESRSLTACLCEILDFAECLQERTDNGIFTLPESCPVFPAEEGDFQEILCFLQTLEPIDAKWHPLVHAVSEQYTDIIGQKNRFIAENPQVSGYLRNIAVYFIWRYFLKGVFDGEFLSRVKLVTISTAIIGCMFAGHFLKNGHLSPAACVQIAKNYSKEIEYSEENLNALLDAAYSLSSMNSGRLKGLFLSV